MYITDLDTKVSLDNNQYTVMFFSGSGCAVWEVTKHSISRNLKGGENCLVSPLRHCVSCSAGSLLSNLHAYLLKKKLDSATKETYKSVK